MHLNIDLKKINKSKSSSACTYKANFEVAWTLLERVNLRQKLGYSLYSVLGWGEGAKVALTLAIKYPSSVDKLVVWGACSHATESDTAKLIANYQPQSWDKARQTLFNDIYGEKTFQVLWKVSFIVAGTFAFSFHFFPT